MKLLKKIVEYLLIIGMAAANAVIYAIFVYPNQFAPSGFNGIATIVQYLFDINVGYLSLLFNVPLIIAVFILVDREFALKSMAYVVTFSVLSILTQKPFLDLSAFAYQTETGTSIVMGPMVAGILMGGIIGILLLANASTGGTDLVAALIHKYKPNYGFVWVTFALNSFVALLSFISSNGQMEPVLMCIVYCYLSTAVTDKMLKGSREAIKVEVITEDPEGLASEIIEGLGHSVTIVDAKGGYTHEEKKMVISVINKDELMPFKQILNNHPGAFAVISSVTSTVGRFKTKRKNKSIVS